MRSAGSGLRLCGLATAVLLFHVPAPFAQTAENVAVVINTNSEASQRIGEHYALARRVPESNIIRIRTLADDAVERSIYTGSIEQPIAAHLTRNGLQDRILYIVLTKGVPLRINGTAGQDGTLASVDSELTLLYRRMTGATVFVRGRIENPYFAGTRAIETIRPFTHREHDIYLVTRLDAFTVEEAIALVDRGLVPATGGTIVLDQQDRLTNRTGEDWLARAAERLTVSGAGERVLLENTVKPARGVTSVLGYYSWGSTDPRNRVRTYEMGFVPGALASTYVGTDARTFREPPANWMPTASTNSRAWFGGSAQSLLGDLIREGVTGAAGHVAEPYLQSVIRPDVLFPGYLAGLNLAEAFYAAMPHLSWQTVVIGDPLCAPFRRETLTRAELEQGIDPTTDLPTDFSRRRLTAARTLTPGLPDGAITQAVRAEHLVVRGDRVAARVAFEAAVAEAPDYVQPLLNLAMFDSADGNHDAAIEKYRRVVALDPKHVVALNNLAYALAVNAGTPAEALPFARRAVAQEPENPTILDTLGWTLHLLGEHAEAVKVMQTVARANLRSAEIRLHTAIVFAAAGARAVAESELAIALKLDPALEEQEEVRQLRERLQLPRAGD